MTDHHYPTTGGSYRVIDGQLVREDDAPAAPAPDPAAPAKPDPTPAQRGRTKTPEE